MRHRRLLGRVWTGVVAAAVPGILAGVVTRLLMRLIAHTVNDQPGFSWTGSVGIVLIYVATLLPGCVALACSRGRWPWLLFSASVVLLTFEAIAIGVQETAAAHDMGVGRWILLLLLLTAMTATYAAQFIAAARLARRDPAVSADSSG